MMVPGSQNGQVKIELGRRYRFAASHRLHNPSLSEEENYRLYGKCNNPYGHGHNYVLEILISGKIDPATGMVANLVDLDSFVAREVLESIRSQIAQRRCRPVSRHGAHDGKPVHRNLPPTETVPQSEPRARAHRGDIQQQFRVRWRERRTLRGINTMAKPTEEIVLNDEKELDARRIAYHMREIIKLIGEDPCREGLRKTPERFEKALKFLTSGYHQNAENILNGATFSVSYDEMVVVKDIEFFSLCEHHLLPFFGKCHVAYLPNKRVIGLSKVARLVNMFARRLQIQERLTSQIAEAIQEKISPEGVGVIIEARHLCMQMRGVEKQHGQAVTSAMLGGFRHNKQTRDEFLALIRTHKS